MASNKEHTSAKRSLTATSISKPKTATTTKLNILQQRLCQKLSQREKSRPAIHSTFYPFSRLPPEIRDQIWLDALPGPRMVNLAIQDRQPPTAEIPPKRNLMLRLLSLRKMPPQPPSSQPQLSPFLPQWIVYSNTTLPVLLSVCHDSRTIALSKYVRAFPKHGGAPMIYVDFTQDTIYLNNWYNLRLAGRIPICMDFDYPIPGFCFGDLNDWRSIRELVLDCHAFLILLRMPLPYAFGKILGFDGGSLRRPSALETVWAVEGFRGTTEKPFLSTNGMRVREINGWRGSHSVDDITESLTEMEARCRNRIRRMQLKVNSFVNEGTEGLKVPALKVGRLQNCVDGTWVDVWES